MSSIEGLKTRQTDFDRDRRDATQHHREYVHSCIKKDRIPQLLARATEYLLPADQPEDRYWSAMNLGQATCEAAATSADRQRLLEAAKNIFQLVQNVAYVLTFRGSPVCILAQHRSAFRCRQIRTLRPPTAKTVLRWCILCQAAG